MKNIKQYVQNDVNILQVLPPKFVSLNLNCFETPLMKAEFDRVASRQPMDTLSMKRYELPTPPAGKMTDVAACISQEP